MSSADKLYLGNVITMDERKPRAEAVAVKDGLILYVGSSDVAKKLCDENTEIIDLGTNTIYPGFLEAHCHPLGAGQNMDAEGAFRLNDASPADEALQVIKQFIDAHPGRPMYKGGGLTEPPEPITAEMLDVLCDSAPVLFSDINGHSVWMNTEAMKFFSIDKDAVEKFGAELFSLDTEGNPTGLLRDAPAMTVMKNLPSDLEANMRDYKIWEQFAFSKGYTGCYDAGWQFVDSSAADAYEALIEKGEFRLRTYAGSIIDEFCEDIPAALEQISADQARYNSEYFKIIGPKLFADGVVESHTAFLLDDYADQPGFKGVPRLADHDRLVQIYRESLRRGMNVHVHTIGDASVRCYLDVIEEVASPEGNMDHRFALCHLQVVSPEDVRRFGDLNVMAVAAPLWAPKDPGVYKLELSCLGPERAEAVYPMKDFYDAGAVVGFHTDFPVSSHVDIPRSIYDAVTRMSPAGGPDSVRGADQVISRYQALSSLTKNVAYMWREEDRLGTLEIGKIANMAVFDRDFLMDDLEEVLASQLVCTVVDGDIVYQPKGQ